MTDARSTKSCGRSSSLTFLLKSKRRNNLPNSGSRRMTPISRGQTSFRTLPRQRHVPVRGRWREVGSGHGSYSR